jgi:hypothetical protein
MVHEKREARVDGNGRAYAGSQRQIQAYVNEAPQQLSFEIAKAFSVQVCADEIEWVSPLESQGYAEYRDADFLRAVGLSQCCDQLTAFWPRRGPCWDALARYRNGCILVEAKSHVTEIYGGRCAASEKSLAAIRAAVALTKQWLRVPEEADWLGRLYQSANRYAYLYFLLEVSKVPCYLANVYFTDDPRTPTSESEWLTAIKAVNRELQLSAGIPYCRSVILPAHDHDPRPRLR